MQYGMNELRNLFVFALMFSKSPAFLSFAVLYRFGGSKLRQHVLFCTCRMSEDIIL